MEGVGRERAPGKLEWSLIWLLAPALFVLGLPCLFALTTGRYFDHVMLTRTLPQLLKKINGSARQRTVDTPRMLSTEVN
jgi:hypothetical protein